MQGRGSCLGLGFSIPKTKLIQWRINRDRHPSSQATIHLATSVFRSKDELRSLWNWFTPSLSTTSHFTKCLAKAQVAFVAIKRLSPAGMGIPPFLYHRLASSLRFPILGSGGHVFTPTVHMMRKLSAFRQRPTGVAPTASPVRRQTSWPLRPASRRLTCSFRTKNAQLV